MNLALVDHFSVACDFEISLIRLHVKWLSIRYQQPRERTARVVLGYERSSWADRSISHRIFWTVGESTRQLASSYKKGRYALAITTGPAPSASLDTSFMDSLGLQGYVGVSGRGTVSGSYSGTLPGLPVTIGFSVCEDSVITGCQMVTRSFRTLRLNTGFRATRWCIRYHRWSCADVITAAPFRVIS